MRNVCGDDGPSHNYASWLLYIIAVAVGVAAARQNLCALSPRLVAHCKIIDSAEWSTLINNKGQMAYIC